LTRIPIAKPAKGGKDVVDEIKFAEGAYNPQYRKHLQSYAYSIKQVRFKRNDHSQVETSDFRWIGTDMVAVTQMEVTHFKKELRIVIQNATEVHTYSTKGVLLHRQQLQAVLFNQQTSLLFTELNKIGFFKTNGTISSVYCRAEETLVAAVTDGFSAGHVYGLSKTGTVFVFRTSNLLLTPDTTECTLEAKVQAASSGYKMISIKGGLLVKSDLTADYVYLNTSTFMLNRIKQFPDFELPEPQ
jgi:hypothetical protein